MTPLPSYSGPCWRAVAAGRQDVALEGTVRAGRYNRSSERTLYMSNSPEGVAAAMARYGDAPRELVKLTVWAERLIDLRDLGLCTCLAIDPSAAKQGWLAALNRGDEPTSWAIADRARELGATGLIDASRQAWKEWHLILFRWNVAGGASVTVDGPSRG